MSKIGIFRNSGTCKIRSNEKWHSIETVEQFTYLGIIFNYNDKFTKAEQKLLEQARKALYAFKRNTCISNMTFNNETLLSLFDCYIGCIVNNVSEIWGSHKENNVEKLHLEFCKQMLGVIRCE